MAQFTNFLNILPSPTIKIGGAGQDESDGGTQVGPGYASVKLTSDQKILKTRTNSGRYTARSAAYQNWQINITYNPMTRSEFSPIYTFLLEKQGGLKPFYISLPQYENPQDATFASNGLLNSLLTTSLTNAGETKVLLRNGGYNHTTGGKPSPGDIFNISDPSDSNHKKVYMVTRVEDSVYYNESAVAIDEIVIHVTPPFAKNISSGSSFVFGQVFSSVGPLFKVVAKDQQEYSLGTDNLYQFSLSLEEVQ